MAIQYLVFASRALAQVRATVPRDYSSDAIYSIVNLLCLSHAVPRLSGSESRSVISGITPDKQYLLFRLVTEQGMPSIYVVLNWQTVVQNR